MTEFHIGDWVYAEEWCYGQIIDIDGDFVTVGFDTGRGGGSVTFGLEDVSPAEAPATDDKKETGKPNYAVIVTFSYDPQVSVLLFDTWDEAMTFIRKDILEEYELDKEYGRPSKCDINKTEGRAVLKTCYESGVETTEWRIGTIFDHREDRV